MTTSMGKTIRLGRLFDTASQTSMILPMDHGIEEAGYAELERPAALVASLAEAGVDAFLMRRGLAAFALGSFAGRAGWVQRLTGRTGLSPGLETEQLVFASVEEALRNGADAVVPTFFIGPDTEAIQLPQLGAIADECNRLGVPLLAEIFPQGDSGAAPYDGPYTVDDMRVAVRVASEEGADLIKTWYTGDPESFRKVVDYSLVPVLIAGGPKADNEEDVLRMVRGAMDAGAAGIAMGRKIWRSSDPAGMVRALAAIIRDGATVDEAAGLLAQGRQDQFVG
jgi:fructose-bisphosphate aldolase / 2-amino-3,7-dideoxy-D-threo-hept-6-ulosonate synthase